MWISLFIVMFVIFLVCVAFTWNEGAWNNILTYFMALFSAIMATNYYAAIGVYLTYVTTIHIPFVGPLREYTGAATYLWDIISFWFIFGMTFALLRLIVDRLSKFKVKFKKPVEIIFNWLMSFSIGALMVTIFLFTVHIAPLARHPFGGAFMEHPYVPGPSRVWMMTCSYWSSNFGSLSNLWRANTFGPPQEFIDQHYWRRRTLEGEGGFTVDLEDNFGDAEENDAFTSSVPQIPDFVPPSDSPEQNPQAIIEEMARGTSERLPIRINANTTLIEVRAGNHEMINVFRANGVSDQHIAAQRAALKADASRNLVNRRAAMAVFFEHRIPITQIYQNEEGIEVMRFTINPWEL